jgi:hypothetical protein
MPIDDQITIIYLSLGIKNYTKIMLPMLKLDAESRDYVYTHTHIYILYFKIVNYIFFIIKLSVFGALFLFKSKCKQKYNI